MTVPVQIIAGFLGAGKTSAIRARLRARHGERIAVIVNDFGEAALDAATLADDEPFRITNIPGGCVCCTAPEGFVDALGAVLAEAPDHLIIEPTGLARPQDLIDTLRRCEHREAFELAPVIALVDPHGVAETRARGDTETLALLREQLEAADVVVANRTDLCSADELEALRRWVDTLWPRPLALHETQYGELPDSAFEWPDGERGRIEHRTPQAHEHDHGDSTEGFCARSWRWPSEVSFSRDRLGFALERAMAPESDAPLVRFKGIFRTLEGVSRIEVAGGTVHDRQTSYRRDSRADAIVKSEDPSPLMRLGKWLEDAQLRPDELKLNTRRIEVVLPDGRVHSIDRDRLTALPDPLVDVSTRFPKRTGSAARIESLFTDLGVPRDGRAVVVAGDGFASEPVALDVLRQGVLLHTLDGAPLPDTQGGPFRLLIPDDASAAPASCSNVKGVAKIVVRES